MGLGRKEFTAVFISLLSVSFSSMGGESGSGENNRQIEPAERQQHYTKLKAVVGDSTWFEEAQTTLFLGGHHADDSKFGPLLKAGSAPEDVIALLESKQTKQALSREQYPFENTIAGFLMTQGAQMEDLFQFQKEMKKAVDTCIKRYIHVYENGDPELGFWPGQLGQPQAYFDNYGLQLGTHSYDDFGHLSIEFGRRYCERTVDYDFDEEYSVVTKLYDIVSEQHIEVGQSNLREYVFNQAFYPVIGMTWSEMLRDDYFSKDTRPSFN
ncbi:hypothetical protein [Vibrio sp. WXL103]|uniref:hypothetical protein n=1 Tax=unclassified Vibrio TaxID=2614977 RepID=UPI003EC56460